MTSTPRICPPSAPTSIIFRNTPSSSGVTSSPTIC
jgi:hypothetical protein